MTESDNSPVSKTPPRPTPGQSKKTAGQRMAKRLSHGSLNDRPPSPMSNQLGGQALGAPIEDHHLPPGRLRPLSRQSNGSAEPDDLLNASMRSSIRFAENTGPRPVSVMSSHSHSTKSQLNSSMMSTGGHGSLRERLENNEQLSHLNREDVDVLIENFEQLKNEKDNEIDMMRQGMMAMEERFTNMMEKMAQDVNRQQREQNKLNQGFQAQLTDLKANNTALRQQNNYLRQRLDDICVNVLGTPADPHPYVKSG